MIGFVDLSVTNLKNPTFINLLDVCVPQFEES